MPVEVLTPGDGQGVERVATTESILDQRFVEMHARLTHGAQRLQDANDNVSEQTKLGYLTEQRVVGVREAKASTLLQPVVGQPVPVGLGGTVGIKTGA
jgi:hypothetical protein